MNAHAMQNARRNDGPPLPRHGLLYAMTATVIASALAAVTLLLAATPAQADGHVYDITSKTYQSECSACHVAFPPQLMSAASWRAIMSGLDKHFGTDASIDTKAAEELRRYLEQNASTRSKHAASDAKSPRITTAGWFVREHREVAATIRSNKSIGSAANCAACHTRADQGDFSERSLRVPR
jgi:hypothetical protein